ncbi:MAG: hypothetical protein OXH20_05615 [bacterium]|nr:hypothetical protein [bacterium]MDE0668060.1 hypothetical protein [bacterium]MYB23592.1 hypothetical protein [Acidimicrobiia bacterium]MYJ13726.1 hypothetical protein [Acidimicrobiia bacterium]
MNIACWSVKGGSGTSVTAALAARRWADTSDTGALLVDLCGDAAGLLGVPEPATPGVADWLNVGDEVQIDALRRLEREVAAGLSLLHRGAGPLCRIDRAEVMARELAADHRVTVVDGGCLWRAGGEEAGGAGAGGDPDDIDVRRRIVAAADRSWLVTRACFLALRRAARAPLQPTGVVLLNEPGRPLTAGDVEDVVGAPVVLRIDVDPAVARATDAGLLASRVPAALDRVLTQAAPA